MNFKNNDPWKQMLDRIGLNCSREEFLGALNALGQLSNQRCLILIDALNESEERHFWKTYIAGMIEVAEQYEYLSIGYSIRATYEDTVIPDELLKNNKLIRIVHNGFNDLGFEAIRQFFNFYKLEIPSIPLLLPEYYNPMFLKIFCENLKAEGKSKITKGGVELTKIFDGFVSRVNKNLAAPKYLDFNPKQNIVRNIIYALTEEMFKTNQNWIKYDDAEKIINEIIPAKNKGYSNSPIKYLESENIIFQNRYLVSFNPSKYEDGVTLIYDKFTDYLKAKYIIENCPTFTILKKKIEELINSYNYGIVDMLSVLLPENKDKELFEYIEISNKNENRIIESFLNSLIWRSPSTITEKTFDFINKYIIKYEKSLHNFFDIVISLAAFEKHPLNILRLHDFFIKLPMAERDYIWTLYLNKNYEKGNIIYNTIEWANNFDNVKTLSVESSELYSILVGWFLTSSNRFLRDRATKALVFLLSNNPQIIVNILDKFKEVNDDYILERLVAAAYGASMIIKNNNLLKTLAQYIYDWQFNNNSPLSNILFRDYCREIIELALHRKLKLNINIDNIRPPYKSEWPSFKIPTLRSLEKYGKFNDKYPEHEKYKNAIINIYSSVLSWGDFARYIIGTNSNRSYWKKLKLNSKKKYMIPQTREKNFLDSLTTNQTEFLKKYFDIRQKVFHNDLLERIGRTPEETKNTQENAKILDSELQKKKNDLLNSLNSKKRKEFNDFFDEYSSNSHNYYQKELFDLKVIQRWVFQKVLNLGWEVDKFGYYDWHLNRYGGDYRSPHKVERIGKKYQWIALYECLARIADNFQFSDEYGGIYEGPWQIGRREIDPSCLLYNTKRQDWFENHHQTWYFPVIYNSWNKFKTEIDWIKTTEDLPDLNSLLEVESCDKEKWYLLNASYNWKESITIETEILNKKYKEIWYMIKSYFIKKKDKEKLTEWLEKQNFYGRWMTEESELRHIFMGEMFWSPAYKNEILEYENLSWIKPNSYNKIPVDIMVSCCEYIIEDSGYDCSIDESILIYMPCELLFNKLNIQSTADFGEYYNHKNELIAIDPSIELNGPGAFLIKQDSLKSFLNENNLDIFWIVMGEKRIFDNASLYARKNHPGMLEISGYSFLNDQTNLKTKIKGKYFKK
ncbi:hypothetical protein KA977_06680 [Candidatus Dependentiae bacterium]|nr:hypothetical protein [Candidatus Dependentiae bacterium]